MMTKTEVLVKIFFFQKKKFFILFDIFSSFDYSSYSKFFVKKLSHCLFLGGSLWIIFFFSFYFSKKNVNSLSHFVLSFHKENTKKKLFESMKSFYLVVLFVFFFVMLKNLWGLVPYIFVNTGQILFVMKMSFFFWLSVVVSSFFSSPLHFAYLFFPNSPGFILPFLKVIEMVSFMIRPVTLSLRLSMKITTGHILMGLISKMCLFLFSNFKMSVLVFLLALKVGFFGFELCIGIIQGLVFSLLLKSYFEEHTH